MKKPKIVSKAAFARAIGVTPPAVTKAVADGRISVRSDGMIDLESAKRQWRQNTDQARSPVKFDDSPEPQSDPVVRRNGGAATVVSPEAESVIGRLLADQGISAGGPLTLANAKVAEMVSRTLAREFEIAIKRKEFVPLDAVQRHIQRMFGSVKQAFVAMPARYSATLAGRLGVDPHVLEWGLREMVNDVLRDLSEPPTLAESVNAEPAVDNATEGAA